MSNNGKIRPGRFELSANEILGEQQRHDPNNKEVFEKVPPVEMDNESESSEDLEEVEIA